MNKHLFNILDNKLKLRYIFKHKLLKNRTDGWLSLCTHFRWGAC